ADIRRYYESKKAEEFTERATARWRMIRITSKNMGGVAEAEAKANELHERVTRGEDFASVAGSINHDPLLLRNAGDVGEIDKGAYRLEEVEAAAWALEPGQISPVPRRSNQSACSL
ncbi:MAG TPA: peptidylprolyl isomerase, partial [Tepidisphaeraceae bacterium]|nr:peptidylprolyl isomerase [Tepidisphaeraceae bacterium]